MKETGKISKKKTVIVVECYHGVYLNEITSSLQQNFCEAKLIHATKAMSCTEEIDQLVYPFVTDDPVFGYIAPLELKDFFDQQKIKSVQKEIGAIENGIVFVYGQGASLIESN